MIDAAFLRALGVGNSASELYAPLLAEACPLWEIDEPREVAAFLANCTHECAKFTAFRENLNYSAQALANSWNRFSATGKRRGPPNELALSIARNPQAIANAAYCNRMGNGDEDSNDGWVFRGGGIIQLTGRANYAAFSEAWGQDLVTNPELIVEPEAAVVSACWFWKTKGCNELAQAGEWVKVREKVNGGDNGLAEVNALLETALQYLGVE